MSGLHIVSSQQYNAHRSNSQEYSQIVKAERAAQRRLMRRHKAEPNKPNIVGYVVLTLLVGGLMSIVVLAACQVPPGY